MAISEKDLENIALLSKLEIKKDEMAKLLSDMDNIIEFANKINSIELEDLDFDNVNGLKNQFRDDVVVESLDQEEILKNAKTKDDGFFVLNNCEIV